eukprot:8532406-Pyramimonas_sp.AAC.1
MRLRAWGGGGAWHRQPRICAGDDLCDARLAGRLVPGHLGAVRRDGAERRVVEWLDGVGPSLSVLAAPCHGEAPQ